MLVKRIILLVIIFVLNLSAPALAAEAGGGIIEGRIVNGTEGSSSVADQDVTLKTYQNDAEKKALLVTQIPRPQENSGQG